MAQLWEVVGGEGKGGVIVRSGQELSSPQVTDRLSTGALVKEMELIDSRLRFELVEGTGPREGWISIKLKDKDVAVKSSKTVDEDGFIGEDDGGDVEVPADLSMEVLYRELVEERRHRTKLEREMKVLRARVHNTPDLWALGERRPTVDASAWIAPGAAVIGTVTLEKNASVWFNCTVRGDNELITIGEGTDIQDNSVLHCDPGKPLKIGKNVLVGHQCCLHGCTIGDNCLIGMRSMILDNAEIGDNCFVAAGSVVPEGKKIPPNSFVQGNPVKRIDLQDEQLPLVQYSAMSYVENKERFREGLTPFRL